MEGELPLRSVVARDGFYLATLEGSASTTGSDAATSRGVLEQLQAAHAGSRVGGVDRGEPDRGATGVNAPRPTDGPTASPADRVPTGATVGGEVLSRLQGVIAQRQATMPEGSYTTHLFQKGPDKIRKKTGEEAVELLLARTNDEMLSEAADLIYHLMVLLQASGLHINAVLERLAGRMDG
ncbi:MAG: phosphoribosyl-ATP diphosphatase [Spirochaetaceae bacterium]|nr:MAG: phosphoribosyl-ATP diphosphatase [Spirochaetaceae bacterium]